MQDAIVPTLPNWSLILATCWMLACVISGWSKGLIRQLLSVVSLVGGGYAGYQLALPASQWLPESLLPGILRIPVAALIGALACWVVCTMLSALLIKETENQKLGIIRLLWGFGGAALGVAYGLMTLMAAYEIHRTGQSLAYGYARGRITARSLAESQPQKAGDPSNSDDSTLKASPSGPSGKPAASAPIVLPDLQPKNPESLQGQFSLIAAAWDPIPQSYYILASRFAEVFSNPLATTRLFAAPALQAIGQNLPQNFGFNVLVKDEQLRRSLRQADLWGILTNANLAATLKSQTVRNNLSKINPNELIDFALTMPAAPSR